MDYIKYCPLCGERMKIFDRVENYYDDYSPYIDYQINEFTNSPFSVCSHVCICPRCGRKEILGVRNVAE